MGLWNWPSSNKSGLFVRAVLLELTISLPLYAFTGLVLARAVPIVPTPRHLHPSRQVEPSSGLEDKAASVLATPKTTQFEPGRGPLRQASTERSRTPAIQTVEGLSVDATIRGGERQSYHIKLSRGEYVRVTLDKGDLSLSLAILGPDQSKIADITNLPRAYEICSFVSKSSGIYILAIQSNEKPGYASHFVLRSDAPRKATYRDGMTLSAQASLRAGDRLRTDWKAESFAQAIKKYQESQSYFRRTGNLRGQALSKLGQAEVLVELSRNREALAAFKAALLLAQSAAETRLQIEALNWIGSVLIDLGQFATSLNYSTKARALSERTNDRFGLAESLNNVGLEHYSSGDMIQALPALKEALSIFQETRHRLGQADALQNLGYASEDLGDSPQALDYFNRSQALAEEVGDQRIRALDITAIGLVNSVLGDKQKALELHNRALAILQRMGNRLGEAVVENGLADVDSDIGEYDAALNYYNQSLPIFSAIGETDFEGLTMGLIGAVYMKRKEPERALYWYQRRLMLSKSVGSLWVWAHTLNDIGSVYDAMHQPQRALDYYNRAYAEERARSDRRGQAYSLDSIGFTDEQQGSKESGLQRYNQALQLFRDIADGGGQIQALHNIARVERDLGRLQDAYRSAQELIDLLETQRSKVSSPEFRTAYFASVHEHYELYIDLLMRMKGQNPEKRFAAAAFEANEKAHARGLLDLLREARTDIRQGVDPALLDQERILQASLNSDAEELTRSLNPNPADARGAPRRSPAALKKEIDKLIANYDAVEAEIRAKSPVYASLTQPSIASVAQIQKNLLEPDSVLLEYSLGSERSFVWAITTDSIDAYELPSREKVDELVTKFYNSVSSPPAAEWAKLRLHEGADLDPKFIAARNALSEVILGPIPGKLKARRLIIVADGLLQYVPFSALVDPSPVNSGSNATRPLAWDHEISSVPSASVLLELRSDAAKRQPRSKTIAIFADPVFDSYDSRLTDDQSQREDKTRGAAVSGRRSKLRLGDTGDQGGPAHFARLAAAGKEADAIAELVPPNECSVFRGLDANRATAMSSDLSKYRIIHFATHSVIDNAHPALSGIVLSLVDKEGQPTDGFLRLNEVYNMKLGADLVVLSACQTALGKPEEGEGLLGLTRGFMYAGASRVVASLWEVDDQATEELMKHFYEGLLTRHLAPAEALRQAQMAIRDQPRWHSPYYWAGFVLQGDCK